MKHPLGEGDRLIDVVLLLDLVVTVAVAALSAIDRAVVLLARIPWKSPLRSLAALGPRAPTEKPPPTPLPSDEWYDLLVVFEQRIDSAPKEEQYVETRRLLAASGAFLLSYRARCEFPSAMLSMDTEDHRDAAEYDQELGDALGDAVKKIDNATTVLLQGSRSADPVSSLQAALRRPDQPPEQHCEDGARADTTTDDYSISSRVRLRMSFGATDGWRHPDPWGRQARHRIIGAQQPYPDVDSREPLLTAAQRNLAEARSQLADTLGFLTDHSRPVIGLRSSHGLHIASVTDLLFVVINNDVSAVGCVQPAPVAERLLPSPLRNMEERFTCTTTIVGGASYAVVGLAPTGLSPGTNYQYHQSLVASCQQVNPAGASIHPWTFGRGVVLDASASARARALDVTGDTLLSLADEMQREGRLRAALACYSSARLRFREARDSLGERNALLGAADALHSLNRHDEATRFMKEADEVADNSDSEESPLLRIH